MGKRLGEVCRRGLRKDMEEGEWRTDIERKSVGERLKALSQCIRQV